MNKLIILLLLLISINVSAQVGINTTTPHASSALDIDIDNKGLLIPRVSLISLLFSNPIMAAETSLLIYNTNATIGVGYYYWSGSEWKKLTTSDDVSVMDDADFFRLGTTLSPTLITQGIYTLGSVGIGRDTTNATLDIEGTQIIGDPATVDENSFVINALGREGFDTTSVSLGSSGVNGEGLLRLYNNTDTRNIGVNLSAEINTNSYVEGAGTALFGVGTTTPLLGKLEVVVNPTDTNTKSSLYVKNNAGYDGPLSTYSIRTLNVASNTGTKYGLYSSISSAGRGTRVGIYNSVNNNVGANGSVTGLRNSMTALNGIYNKYGVLTDLTAVSQSTGEVYGMKNNITGGLGETYGSYNDVGAAVGSSADLFGYYANVDNDGSGIKYGAYLETTGAGNYGLKAENTDAAGFAASFNGNTEIQNGSLTVGAVTIGTLKRAEFKMEWQGNFSIDYDGYQQMYIGRFDYPIVNSPASVTVKRIKWKARAHHADGDEDHGVWIQVGGGPWYGYSGEAITSKTDIDWQYISPVLSLTKNYNSIINVRIEDKDCGLCGDDVMRLDNIEVVIEYEYTDTLDQGDIAASGRVYANSSSQMGDLAEYFEVPFGHSEIGDIITLKTGANNEYQIATERYSQHIVGVVSENPSVVLNNPAVGPPVALAGRVKVKVKSDEVITSGDFLTTSTIPGVAMLATEMGPVIGYAVENKKEGEGFVEILLQPGRLYIPKD